MQCKNTVETVLRNKCIDCVLSVQHAQQAHWMQLAFWPSSPSGNTEVNEPHVRMDLYGLRRRVSVSIREQSLHVRRVLKETPRELAAS